MSKERSRTRWRVCATVLRRIATARCFVELHPDLLRARGHSPHACVRALLDAGYAGWTIDQSPGAYRRATSPRIETREMLRPLAEWTTQAWPHLLWLAPGEVLR